MRREEAFKLIEAELDRYHYLWDRPDGSWPASNDVKYRVLGEEVGEIAKAINDKDFDNLPVEIVQTASVCIAWLMSLGDQ